MTLRNGTRRLDGDFLRLSKVIGRFLLYVACVVLASIFVFPFFYTVMSSLKQPWEMFAWPPILIPKSFQWQNYATVFEKAPFMRWFWNTITLTFLSTTGGVLTSSLVAFSFSRFDYRGRDVLFMITLSTMMLPAQVTLIPRFILFFKLGEWTPVQFLDTLRPLWVPAWFGGGAFGIFLMRQFIQTIPNELDEAALIDGASYPRIFSTIILPLCKPVIATLAIITFLGSWNAFIGPMIYINTPEKFPISVGLQYFKQSAGGMSMEEPQQHLLMCASVLSTIVPIAVFFSFQNVFVKGVVMTGIKG